jgi:RND family efflux transporter MFP subunit
VEGKTMSEEDRVDAGTGAGESQRRGRAARLLKPLGGLVALAVVILWSAGVFRTRTPPGRLASEPGLPVPPGAESCTVKSEAVAPRVDVVGTVASGVKVNLSARMPAYVKEVFVSAGSFVKKGQALLTLDDREILEQVAAAEAQFRQAETEFNRTRQLFDSKAATDQALTAAQSGLAAARAQLERSKVMLSYARIESPMDGLVTDRRVEPGDLANPGQVLLAVYDPSNMQLEVPVPVRLLSKLPVGQAVDVTLDRPARTFQGKVRQIVSEIDPLSRTQLVKVHIEESSPEILPGTFGRLWVADDARQTILIPASAVYAAGQIEMVQVVRDRRAIRRAVRTGPRRGADVEVLSGLSAGEVVLVNPAKEN